MYIGDNICTICIIKVKTGKYRNPAIRDVSKGSPERSNEKSLSVSIV